MELWTSRIRFGPSVRARRLRCGRCLRTGGDIGFEEYSTSFGHSIEVTEEEVSICGLKTPISSIKDVVLFPISGNMRGLGGCIKFVTEDNPELPVLNEQRGWDVVFQGEVNSGFDLARGNCFWYGGDYSESGWVEQNAKAEEIVEFVKSMLS